MVNCDEGPPVHQQWQCQVMSVWCQHRMQWPGWHLHLKMTVRQSDFKVPMLHFFTFQVPLLCSCFNPVSLSWLLQAAHALRRSQHHGTVTKPSAPHSRRGKPSHLAPLV